MTTVHFDELNKLNNRFGNKPASNYATVMTKRSKAKGRQKKDETIKQQTSYLAITEFILIIGC